MNISIYLREALKPLRKNILELYDIYWMFMIQWGPTGHQGNDTSVARYKPS